MSIASTGRKVFRCRIASPTRETVWVLAYDLAGVDNALGNMYLDIPYLIEWVQCESQKDEVLMQRND